MQRDVPASDGNILPFEGLMLLLRPGPAPS